MDSTKWKLIDSAPKDGTAILLWDGDCVIANWCFESWRLTRDGAYSEDSSLAAEYITHWQELPSGPTES
jgi:hypothetical protein